MRLSERWLHVLDGRGARTISSILLVLFGTGYVLLKGPVTDRAREIQRAEPIPKNRPLWLLFLEDLELVDPPAVHEAVEVRAGPPPPLPQPKRRPAPEWQPTSAVTELPFALTLTEAVAQAGIREVRVLDARCPDENFCWAWGTGRLNVSDVKTLEWTPAFRTLTGPDDERRLRVVQHASPWEGEPPFFAIAYRPDSEAYATRFARDSAAARRVYESGDTDLAQALADAGTQAPPGGASPPEKATVPPGPTQGPSEAMGPRPDEPPPLRPRNEQPKVLQSYAP